MSVIAAKVTPEYISVAADSILIKEEMKRTTNFPKLIQVNNMIVGGAGCAEELSLFQRFVTEKKPRAASIEGIQDFMRDFDRWKESYTNSTGIDNCYLLVFDNHLFEIDGMFVQEINDYTAIGDGEAYALTALHLGFLTTEAVKVTCDLCASVSEPIVEYIVTKES